jgi:hypothetical protein
MVTPEQFDKWFEGLGYLDQRNFETLIRLPKAKTLVAEMSDGQYKDMAAFILDKATKQIKDCLGL